MQRHNAYSPRTKSQGEGEEYNEEKRRQRSRKEIVVKIRKKNTSLLHCEHAISAVVGILKAGGDRGPASVGPVGETNRLQGRADGATLKRDE